MPDTTNPLDTAHDAIWTLLEAQTGFLTMFPSHTAHQDRSGTTAVRYPAETITEPAPAHYPICRVRFVSSTPATERTSSSSFMDVSFVVEVKTGQEQQSVLRDAIWYIYRALLGWRTYARDAIVWNGTSCVWDVDAKEIGFIDTANSESRSIHEWITVWSTQVRFYFATADLQVAGT